MRRHSVNEIAGIVGGVVTGENIDVGPDVVIDSRQATPGALFVARRGEHADGHKFVDSAVANGAVAAIVEHFVNAPLAQVLVADSGQALSQLAHHIAVEASACGMTTLAITGSSGKTSTKDLLAQILELAGPTVSPRNSFNSQTGLPLTLTTINTSTRYLVAEMGASHIGEIAKLCAIARPDIATVLNVGHAHIGEFGSRQAIAQAKGEIIEALEPSGWAVLNADDPLVAAMASRTKASLAWVSPSGQPPADATCWVGAKDVRLDDLDRVSFRLVGAAAVGRFDLQVSLQTIGAHQIGNACAAAGLALCAGLSPTVIAEGLNRAVARSAWRMQPVLLGDGSLLLNDAYNANPDSMAVALATLSRLMSSRPGSNSVAVIGDMLELGADGPAAHEEVGRQAGLAGITVVAVGDFAQYVVAGARRANGEAHQLNRADVADWLESKSFDLVLVKGSRAIGLETVVQQLVEAKAEEPQ